MRNFLSGFNSRIKNLAPYIFLSNKFLNVSKYPKYDMMSLGFSLMLFILDNMLIGRNECSIEDMSLFLKLLIEKNYNEYLNDEEAKELTYYLKDLLNNNGEMYKYDYINTYNGKKESVDVKLIEQVSYEIKGKVQYKLTSQGLDIIFKTREIYAEYKITVEQLYLQQQIKNGVYDEALETINQLNASVRDLREQIGELYLKIRRNALGVDIEELKSISKKTEEQFIRETKIFDEIRTLLKNQKNTYENIEYENLSNNDRKAIRNINNIERQLEIIIDEHTRLLNDKMGIFNEYINVLESSMGFGIQEAIDFEKDVFDEIYTKNLSLDIANNVLKPFLFNSNKYKLFNIMNTFTQQTFRNESEEEKNIIDYEKDIEVQEKLQRETLLKKREKITRFMTVFLESVLNGKENLRMMIGDFPEDIKEKISYDFDFITILIKIHQQKKINITSILKFEDKYVNDSPKDINLEYYITQSANMNRKIRDIEQFSLISTGEDIVFDNGNSIENFRIRRRLNDEL